MRSSGLNIIIRLIVHISKHIYLARLTFKDNFFTSAFILSISQPSDLIRESC